MASLNPTILEGGSLIQNEEIVVIDYHQLLFNYLRLLRFDSNTMSVKHRMKFDKDMFKLPNPKAFHHVCHFLFNKLDSHKAQEMFRDVWPIVDKKQEAQYRKRVQQWFTQIQEVNKDFLFPHINLSIFLSPGGDKFAQLMCALASHILSKTPKCHPSLLPKHSSAKSSLGQLFHLQMLKGNLIAEVQFWSKLTNDFQFQYHQQKQISRELILLYRELCLKKNKAYSELKQSLEQPCFSETQRKSMFDFNNNTACEELTEHIEKQQNSMKILMNDLLAHEKTFYSASTVIHSVISMRKSRPVINGKAVLSQFPPEFVERYQNIHSGTHLELQYKDSRLNFLPLLNLVLFASHSAKSLTEGLNFPSLNDELSKLSNQEEVFSGRLSVIDKLLERWAKTFENQTEAINGLLESNMQSVPMSLQSVTPYRSLLSDKEITEINQENKTPTILRTALRMTPAELGGKTKFHLRTSVESDNFSRLLSKDELLKTSSKTIFHRSDKRRSYENGSKMDNGIPRELLNRKNSLTPDLNKTSLGKTPTTTLHSRLSRGNAAASPIWERLIQAEGSSPAIKSTLIKSRAIEHNSPIISEMKRRSLPRTENILTVSKMESMATPKLSLKNGLNNTANQAKNHNSVMDRAAEAIVYDLVNFDSPVVNPNCIIDPNSSFEKNAFASRNMIPRSPEVTGVNSDLVKILETTFASPSRRSSSSGALYRGSFDTSLKISNTGSWNEDQLDYEAEKGLLDASGASLIDELLDFSLNL